MPDPPMPSVLLVDDDDVAAEAVARGLHKHWVDYPIVIAEDGVTALQILRGAHATRRISKPYLVLLDLNLPRKDGREVLRDMKADEDLRRIPVVVLTTSQAQSDIRRAYELHANCYIQKPLELDGFIEIVKSIQRYWLQMAKLPG